MTTGTDTATELVKIANQEKITKVILGKPRGSFLASIIRKSPAYKILNENNNFDIYFVSPLVTKEIEITNLLYCGFGTLLRLDIVPDTKSLSLITTVLSIGT